MLKKIDLWLILIISIAVIFSLESTLRYYNLNSNIADMGFVLNKIFLSCSDYSYVLKNHVQPIIVLFLPFICKIDSGLTPYILLSFQSLIIFLTILFIYFKVDKTTAIVSTLYWQLWQLTLLDFHFDIIAIPVLITFFYFLNKNKIIIACLSLILLLTIKEPYILQSVFGGLYIIFYGLNKKYKLPYLIYGTSIVLISICYFLVVINYLIPEYDNIIPGSYGPYSWLGNNYLEALKYIIGDPFLVFLYMFNSSEKIVYLFIIFGSIGFIPLLNPSTLFVATPILLASLLSSLSNYYSYTTHYVSGLIPVLIYSFYKSTKKLSKIKLPKIYFMKINGVNIIYLLIPLLFFVYFSSFPISRLFYSNKIFEYNFGVYIPSIRNETIKNGLIKYIGNNVNEIISVQNSVNYKTIYERNKFYLFPHGLLDDKNKADYVVIDTKRPIFIVDTGCDSLYGKCKNKEIENDYYSSIDKLEKLGFKTIYSYDGFSIYKFIK
jgi:uncharacterized membrane protein